METTSNDFIYLYFILFTDIFQLTFSDSLLKKHCVVEIFDKMSTSQILNLLELCQNDFNNTLNAQCTLLGVDWN